jgi:hypothetical protein
MNIKRWFYDEYGNDNMTAIGVVAGVALAIGFLLGMLYW